MQRRRVKEKRSALFALIVLSLIWGYGWIVMKIALRYSGPFDFAALRTLLATVCLFALAGAMKRPLAPARLPEVFLLGFLQTFLFLALSMWALVDGGTGKTAVLVFTMPFWTMILAWPLLGERIHGSQWLAVAMALAGLILILEPWGLRTTLASKVLAVLAGAAWAASAIVAKRIQAKAHMDLLALTSWQMLLGVIPLNLLAWLIPSRPVEWAWPFIGALAFTAIVTTAGGWILWLYVLRSLPAGIASMSALAIPVIAILGSALQLGEVPSPMELWEWSRSARPWRCFRAQPEPARRIVRRITRISDKDLADG